MKNERLKGNPGDYVEIHLVRKIYEGTLLESPRTPADTEKGVILLKLDSGYNIGFNQKDVVEIKVLKRVKEIKDSKEDVGDIKIKKNSAKPNIGMIITGGTIAARLNPKKGGVDWLDTPESLFKFYPEIFDIVNVAKLEVPFMKASEDMDYKDWQKIAKVCEGMINDSNIQGVVITHGTDFLHYTAEALSFFLNGDTKKKLTKPVVLTYSQRSIDRASSDANLNLKCAALTAISDIAEVSLVGHANSDDEFCYIMPGTKTKKLHTSKRDAFKVVNGKPYAQVSFDQKTKKGKIEFLSDFTSRDKKFRKIKSDTKFEDKVTLVKIYPGQNPEILDFYFKKGYRGLILEMSGLGHVPTKRSRNNWVKKIKELIEKRVVVCAVSQCINGRVDPLVYSNGREILESGVIYLGDMLAETALVKLGWVLGHSEWAKNKEKIKEKMLENLTGEIGDRLEF